MPVATKKPEAELEDVETPLEAPPLTREGVPLEEGETDTGFPDVYVPAEDATEALSAPAAWYDPQTVPVDVWVAKTLAFLNAEVYQHIRSEQHDEFTKALKHAL